MPGLFDGLFIGRSGLHANQTALNVAGNNISNVNTPGYTKERVNLDPSIPIIAQPGEFGTGVQVTEIISFRDELIDRRMRNAYEDESYYKKLNSTMDEIQNLFNEENGIGLKKSMEEFFNSWHALALNPDLYTARQQVLEKGQTLINDIKSSYDSMKTIQHNLDLRSENIVNKINSLSKRISQLNYEIQKNELGEHNHANTLRDQRANLLDELSKYANITIMNNAYDKNSKPDLTVLLGGVPLVAGKDYNEIESRPSKDDSKNSVFFIYSSGEKLDITNKIFGGELGAVISLRNSIVPSYKDQLNEIAKSLIQEVNKIHSPGTGLTAYSQVIGSYYLKDVNADISNNNASGLDMTVKPGSFKVKIVDSDGNDVGEYSILVKKGDTFKDVIDRFNSQLHDYATMNISEITKGDIQIDTNQNYKIAFTYDSSHFLAAAGLNTFFTGHDASDMAVNSVLQDDPGKVAAGKTLLPGDSSNAEAIAQLQLKKVMVNNSRTIDEYYNAFLGKIGSTKQRYADELTVKSSIVQQIEIKRESLEGVSLDEEAADLIRFQRAYQANAKFITVIDNMTQTLLGMVR